MADRPKRAAPLLLTKSTRTAGKPIINLDPSLTLRGRIFIPGCRPSAILKAMPATGRLRNDGLAEGDSGKLPYLAKTAATL